MRIKILLVILTVCISSSAWAAQKKICIDAGHGGSDPGAVGCGLEEANVNLDVAWRIHDLMQADPSLKPIMTRTANTSVSLAARVDYANDNGADRFASIHCNAFNGSASGIETFCYSNGSANSFDQRNRIQSYMTATWPALPDRGTKTAGFYVIKYTSMPATLSELAFIDNCSNDANYLSNPDQLQAAAVAHFQAIKESLGLETEPPDPIDPPDGTGVLRGVVFEDLGVGSADMSVRVPGATVKITGEGVQQELNAAPSDAEWMTDLSTGSYTVAVTHPGYWPNSRVCQVTAGQTTWCSVGLFPQDDPDPPDPQTGVLLGVVYEDLGQGNLDMSVRLPGATIAVDDGAGNMDLTTAEGAGADWSIDLAPGTWTVTASHPGYWMNKRVCEVEAGMETWCSIGLFSQENPNPNPDPEPGEGEGLLLGSIYELNPSDPEDMSVRLTDAYIDVSGGDYHTTMQAKGPHALFSLKVPVGIYTVKAAFTDYEPAKRTCAVYKDEETWCSIGLAPEGYVQPDPPDGPPYQPPDGQDALDQGGDSSSEPWNEDPSDEGDQEPDDGTDISVGCSPGPPAAGALLLLLGALGLVLRRRRWLVLVLCVGVLSGASAADRAQHVLRMTDAAPLTDSKGWEQPVWSPDGGWIAFSGGGHEQLLVIPATGGEERLVARGEGVGYRPVWQETGAIGYRHKGQRCSDVPVRAVDVTGARAPSPKATSPGLRVFVRDEQVFLFQDRSSRRLSLPGDRYCCAAVGPNGHWIAFLGLETGLWLYQVSGQALWSLGQGNHPAFDRAGVRLAFDRCLDDGRSLTECKLFIVDLAGMPVPVPVEGAPVRPRHPSFSPSGDMLTFDFDGAIWTGRLE